MTEPTENVREQKRQELAALRQRVQRLEAELREFAPRKRWRGGAYYTAYYATAGFVLGMLGASVSLLFNIVGSLIYAQATSTPQHPLKLIQVYLTFPLGAAALKMDSGLTLALGCCLYLATGMVYGMLFHLALTRYLPDADLSKRLGAVSVMCLALWLVNFYGVLAWLQPMLFGGNWIIEEIPWWVAALTHLVFGWTMVLVYPLGQYQPYRLQTEET